MWKLFLISQSNQYLFVFSKLEFWFDEKSWFLIGVVFTSETREEKDHTPINFSSQNFSLELYKVKEKTRNLGFFPTYCAEKGYFSHTLFL